MTFCSYPTDKDKKELARQTGLSRSQVYTQITSLICFIVSDELFKNCTNSFRNVMFHSNSILYSDDDDSIKVGRSMLDGGVLAGLQLVHQCKSSAVEADGGRNV